MDLDLKMVMMGPDSQHLKSKERHISVSMGIYRVGSPLLPYEPEYTLVFHISSKLSTPILVSNSRCNIYMQNVSFMVHFFPSCFISLNNGCNVSCFKI